MILLLNYSILIYIARFGILKREKDIKIKSYVAIGCGVSLSTFEGELKAFPFGRMPQPGGNLVDIVYVFVKRVPLSFKDGLLMF